MIKIAWDKIYAHALPPGHRFPMEKYELIPQQLLHEGIITNTNLFAPHEAEEYWITKTHHTDYWEQLKKLQLDKNHVRRIGFPLSSELVKRERVIVQGTIENAEFAIKHGVSLNVAGGTHHAGSNWGEGFCLLNDIAVAANYLLEKKLAKKILIIDLDVHQGNGTAEIFAQNDNVFTLSVHGEKNFPFIKEISNLDVPLPDGVDDEFYLNTLNTHLPAVVDSFKPDFVFYQSGVDILNTDKLGKLSVSMNGCKRRDQYVFNLCKINGLPVAVSMGGGYSEQLKDIVEAHCNTFKCTFDLFDN